MTLILLWIFSWYFWTLSTLNNDLLQQNLDETHDSDEILHLDEIHYLVAIQYFDKFHPNAEIDYIDESTKLLT